MRILSDREHGLCNEASEQKPVRYHFNLMSDLEFLTAEVLEARRKIYGEYPNDNNNNVDRLSDNSDNE